ncbi:unnamed protein product [Amoebophrya sp. A120]|nr:unnamed protein product [Amoebophrya sp. A120]|eukprot:GSA120T00012683001.1
MKDFSTANATGPEDAAPQCLFDAIDWSNAERKVLIRSTQDARDTFTYQQFRDFAETTVWPPVLKFLNWNLFPYDADEEQQVGSEMKTTTGTTSEEADHMIVRLPKRNLGILFLDNSAAFVNLFLSLLKFPLALCPFSPKLGPANLQDELEDLANFYLLILDERMEDMKKGGSADTKKLARVVRDFAEQNDVPLLIVENADDALGRFKIQPAVTAATVSSPMQKKFDAIRAITNVNGLDNVALRLHTSGTTKRAKTVPLTHGNLLAGGRAIRETLQLTEKDTALNAMPLFHIHGIAVNVLVPVLSGAAILPLPKFVPDEFFRLVEEMRPTYYSAVPAIHEQLLLHQTSSSRSPAAKITTTNATSPDQHSILKPPPSLRFVRNCSAALLPPTAAKLEKLFGCQSVGTYAMTESMPICSNPVEMRKNTLLSTTSEGRTEEKKSFQNPCTSYRLDSVGYAQGPHVVIRENVDTNPKTSTDAEINKTVAQRQKLAKDFSYCDSKLNVPFGIEGEVCVKGPMVTTGYERNVEDWRDCLNDYTVDGFLRTGDKGYLDAKDKHLVLLGRYKEIINYGGEKLSPFLVESALIQHPRVREVLCFACPHESYGEAVGVLVVKDDSWASTSSNSSSKNVDRKEQVSSFLEQLRTFLRNDSGLSTNYSPEVLVFSDFIPRAHTGKPQRIGLAKRLNITAAETAPTLPFTAREFVWDGENSLVKIERKGEEEDPGRNIKPPSSSLKDLSLELAEPPAEGITSGVEHRQRPPASGGTTITEQEKKRKAFDRILARFGVVQLHRASSFARDTLLSHLLDSISVIQLRAVFLESFHNLKWPLHFFAQATVTELLERLQREADVRVVLEEEPHPQSYPGSPVAGSSTPGSTRGGVVAMADGALTQTSSNRQVIVFDESSLKFSEVTREVRPYLHVGAGGGNTSATTGGAAAGAKNRSRSGSLVEQDQVAPAATDAATAARLCTTGVLQHEVASSSSTKGLKLPKMRPLDENAVPADNLETKIASTAIVKGKLGQGCIIEDFAIIGADVVLGDRCFVGNFARLSGKIEAGDDNVFYDNVSIGNPPQDFFGARSCGKVEIGCSCVFREYVSVNMPTVENGKTAIGSNTMVHSHCNIGHDCVVGERVNLNMNCYLAGFSQVLDDATLSISCSLHQGVIVGPKCFIGMHVALTADVPPFVAVVRRETITITTAEGAGGSCSYRDEDLNKSEPRNNVTGLGVNNISSGSAPAGRTGPARRKPSTCPLYRISIDREGLRRKLRAPGATIDRLEHAYSAAERDFLVRSIDHAGHAARIHGRAGMDIFAEDLECFQNAQKARPSQLVRGEYRLNDFYGEVFSSQLSAAKPSVKESFSILTDI